MSGPPASQTSTEQFRPVPATTEQTETKTHLTNSEPMMPNHEDYFAITYNEKSITVESQSVGVNIVVNSITDGDSVKQVVWSIHIEIRIAPGVVYSYEFDRPDSVKLCEWRSFTEGEVGAEVGDARCHGGYMSIVPQGGKLGCEFLTGVSENENSRAMSSMVIPFDILVEPLKAALTAAQMQGLPFGN